nr:hypothetical protein [Tanacetum cinerariifolium]
MTIQFIFEANRLNLQTEQVLPNVFTETLYAWCPWLYLIHNKGKNTKVATLHFIRQGVDEYYVTAYHSGGFECNGYDLVLVGQRQKRCLVTMGDMEDSPFLVNLKHNQVGDMVSGLRVSTVTQRRVELPDKRMEHECDWVDHEEKHDNEDKCFYSVILAYVIDRNRLTIPFWFVRQNNMRSYHNALLRYEETLFYFNVDVEPHAERADNNNHMNIKKQIGGELHMNVISSVTKCFAFRIKSASSLSAGMWHIESSSILNGIANLECAIQPPSNKRVAIPLDATFNTISPCDRNTTDIIL